MVFQSVELNVISTQTGNKSNPTTHSGSMLAFWDPILFQSDPIYRLQKQCA